MPQINSIGSTLGTCNPPSGAGSLHRSGLWHQSTLSEVHDESKHPRDEAGKFTGVKGVTGVAKRKKKKKGKKEKARKRGVVVPGVRVKTEHVSTVGKPEKKVSAIKQVGKGKREAGSPRHLDPEKKDKGYTHKKFEKHGGGEGQARHAEKKAMHAAKTKKEKKQEQVMWYDTLSEDADFESKHPRGEGGKFASGGGSSKKDTKKKSKKKSGSFTMRDPKTGKETVWKNVGSTKKEFSQTKNAVRKRANSASDKAFESSSRLGMASSIGGRIAGHKNAIKMHTNAAKAMNQYGNKVLARHHLNHAQTHKNLMSDLASAKAGASAVTKETKGVAKAAAKSVITTEKALRASAKVDKGMQDTLARIGKIKASLEGLKSLEKRGEAYKKIVGMYRKAMGAAKQSGNEKLARNHSASIKYYTDVYQNIRQVLSKK